MASKNRAELRLASTILKASMMTCCLQWKAYHQNFCSEEGTLQCPHQQHHGVRHHQHWIQRDCHPIFVVAEMIKEKSILNILDNFKIACCLIGWLSRTRFTIWAVTIITLRWFELDVPARWELKFSKHSAFLLQWEMRARSFLKLRQQWLQLTSLSITIYECIDTKHTTPWVHILLTLLHDY